MVVVKVADTHHGGLGAGRFLRFRLEDVFGMDWSNGTSERFKQDPNKCTLSETQLVPGDDVQFRNPMVGGWSFGKVDSFVS